MYPVILQVTFAWVASNKLVQQNRWAGEIDTLNRSNMTATSLPTKNN